MHLFTTTCEISAIQIQQLWHLIHVDNFRSYRHYHNHFFILVDICFVDSARLKLLSALIPCFIWIMYACVLKRLHNILWILFLGITCSKLWKGYIFQGNVCISAPLKICLEKDTLVFTSENPKLNFRRYLTLKCRISFSMALYSGIRCVRAPVL